jgi:hypothetical protein
MDNNNEYILCAAIKRITPKKCSPYHKGMNDICNIEIGYRHHDIFQRFHGEVSKNSKDQGFYTSKGRFVDRYEAMYIAWRAKQVDETIAFVGNIYNMAEILSSTDYKIIFNKLFSEDLY